MSLSNPEVKIISANIAGLYSRKSKHKVDMLRELAEKEEVSLVALTESHLNEDIDSAEVTMQGYHLYRIDRKLGIKKGGVVVYVRKDLARFCSRMIGGAEGVVEHLILYFEPINFVFVTIYRPECQSHEFTSTLAKIEQFLEDCGSPQPNVMIVGDFNFPQVNWNTLQVKGKSKSASMSVQAQSLLEFTEKFCMEQAIKIPTRMNNILDLVFINNEELILDYSVEPTSLSDHDMIRLAMPAPVNGTGISQPQVTRSDVYFEKLNFYHKNVNWEEINRSLLEMEWEENMEGLGPTAIYQHIKEKLWHISSKLVPEKSSSRIKKIPRDRRILMRKRTKYTKRLITTKSAESKEIIRKMIYDLESKLKNSLNAERNEEERRAVSVIKENPSYFYKYARKKSTLTTNIGPLKKDGVLITENKDIANALQKQYIEVFSRPMAQEHDTTMGNRMENGLREIEFSQADIESAIEDLKSSSAAGPDGIPAVLLKNAKKPISLPLLLLWRSSVENGVIPQELKHGRISPIFKGGCHSDPSNYRPVALTSHVVKVFERVVNKTLMRYLEDTQKMNPNQHGFRKGRSCLSQLVQHHYHIVSLLEANCDVDVIYLDFAKAFDKVDHALLLEKLRRIGICGKVHRWLETFLTNRTQTVRVTGSESEVEKVISGVPQGTVLGPVLFLIHVSDIDQEVKHSRVASFADDTRVLRKVRGPEDVTLLQDDLNSIYDWAARNNMAFNSTKFELIRYKATQDEMERGGYVSPDGVPIERKSAVKDLGVVVSDSGEFGEQINQMVTRAKKKLGWVLRSFETRQREHMLTLYKALILPLLEYCSQLWNPSRVGEIQKLEAVQRTLTARIDGLQHLNYWERLQELRLYSLQRRRERYIIIYMWKMLMGIVPEVKDSNDVGLKTVDRGRKGLYIKVPPANYRAVARVKNMKDSSLLVSGSRLFNCLPRYLREYNGNLGGFKSNLDEFLKRVPDEPALPHYHSVAVGNSICNQVRMIRIPPAERRRQQPHSTSGDFDAALS